MRSSATVVGRRPRGMPTAVGGWSNRPRDREIGVHLERMFTTMCVTLEMPVPAEDTLREHAYLVARGVRPLSLAGHCLADADPDLLLRVATNLERHAEAN